jgi:hypothetical protein
MKNEGFTFDSRQGKEVFPFYTASRLAVETTQPSNQWVLEAKRPEREVDH